MPATHVKLLQYDVQSHSRKGEVVKQQLVQTALQQGLCDLALVQGCTGIHEPLRSGTGVVYQPASTCSCSAATSGNSHCHAGTMFCYTADRFQVQQLFSTPEDLPGFVHSRLLLQEINTGISFVAIAVASHSCPESCIHDPAQLTELWQLMKQLSTQCPVLVAGECTVDSTTNSFCSDTSIQLHLCQPVHAARSISQSFFAASSTSQHQMEISDVESLLARPTAASVQYTQNAHTARCCITLRAAAGEAALSVREFNATSHQRLPVALPSSASIQGSGAVVTQLQVLVNAASVVSSQLVAEKCILQKL